MHRIISPTNQGVRSPMYLMYSLFSLSNRIDFELLSKIWPELSQIPPQISSKLESDAKYSVYLDRQTRDIQAFRTQEHAELPQDIDYQQIKGLSNEARAKLMDIKPANLGQASRIEGITPSALLLLTAYIRRQSKAA